MNTSTSLISACRKRFHDELLDKLLIIDLKGVPSNADKDSKTSVTLARSIAHQLEASHGNRIAGQTSGSKFEDIVESFLVNTFLQLSHLRPGSWRIYKKGSRRKEYGIGQYSQYAHLIDLQNACTANPALTASLGNDYIISPDVVVVRDLEPDETINKPRYIVDSNTALGADIREGDGKLPVLHASISTKWTLRSDRAQNARSEALNLIRNRKGRQPHIAVVTGEPLPTRISSLALGTGDIDCVYHFALYELINAVYQTENEEALNLLRMMIDGKRLKDISDLPLDLSV